MPTKIAWTDESWNPVTGCTPVSEGCAHCYAKRDSKRWGRSFDVTLHPDRLEIPLRWRTPRMVFVPSMGDLFHEDVPGEFIEKVWLTMHHAHQKHGHIFQVLTKRPERMGRVLGPRGFGWYSKEGDVPCPEPGIWLGVSVENQARADERIPMLLETPAAVRFVSAEPLLGPLELHRWLAWEGSYCQSCGKGYSDEWSVSDSLWNQVVGRPGGLRCTRCFQAEAAALGLSVELPPPKYEPAKFEPAVDWVIVGGESGGPPERRLVEPCFYHAGRAYRAEDADCERCHRTGWEPRPRDLLRVRSIRDQCQAAGVPFFFKQWGPRAGQGTLLDGREHKEMP